jgi:hypothetical protein
LKRGAYSWIGNILFGEMKQGALSRGIPHGFPVTNRMFCYSTLIGLKNFYAGQEQASFGLSRVRNCM